MKETVVALLANDKVAYGVVGASESGNEWIIWEQGSNLPHTYFPIIPIETYQAFKRIGGRTFKKAA